MGNMEALYNTWKAIGVSGGDLSFFQNFFVKFYQAFIEADRWLQYLNGVKTTLLVTALALILGVALGVTVAILRTAHDQQRPGHRNPVLAVLNLVCKIYVTVIRGTPMMVQLLIMGFVIFASSRNFTMIGTLTLGINSGAYVSEIVRGGLMSVDKGQMEAGRSLGLSKVQTMWSVIFPQALKNCLPTYTSEFIVLVKETAVVGYIALTDLTKVYSAIQSKTYDAFGPLFIIAVAYFCITKVLSIVFSKMERRLRESDRR